MPDLLRAVATAAASPLFDEEWYAAQTGAAYPSREAAAADYVTHARTRTASPHPLVEPAWLYPGGRWRRDGASDPLTHYLARPDRARVATHPLLPGDAEAWAGAARPDTELPRTAGRAVTWAEVRAAAFAALAPATPPDLVGDAWPVDVSVVLPAGDRFQPVCAWLRLLYRTEIVRDGLRAELLACVSDPAHRRLATLLALTLPGTRVVDGAAAAGLGAARGPVTVLVDPALEPPEWPWLRHLLDGLTDGVGTVGPLVVEPDQTVVAAGLVPEGDHLVPFLRGETPADAARAAHLPVPALPHGVLAFRTADGPVAPAYVVPAARVVSPPGRRVTDLGAGSAVSGDRHGDARWRAAGFEGPGRPIRVVEGRPALRWAIDIAAPLAPRGRRWGDDPFARSLAASLERLGQWVTVDHPETRGRRSRAHDDVVLVLRGLEPVPCGEHDTGARLLWVISHPGDVTAAEGAAYDAVLAAGPAWAAARTREWGRPVRPLLQCTDTRRFRPGLAQPDSGPEVLFVGNSRGVLRPVVRAALEADLDLTIYGDGWGGLVEDDRVAGISVPNAELGALYASAGLVLGDHWADMRERGFVSNRVFDVLACGGRLLIDEVAGLADVLADMVGDAAGDAAGDVVGDAVAVWRDPEDLRRFARSGWRRSFPDAASRLRTAERVLAEHSFDARAAVLLDAALSVVPA
ncbi:MAG: glycosyltransferase [Nocardioides sp.]